MPARTPVDPAEDFLKPQDDTLAERLRIAADRLGQLGLLDYSESELYPLTTLILAAETLARRLEQLDEEPFEVVFVEGESGA